MSAHDDRTCLMHMLDYAREAVEMASGSNREDLDRDRKLQLALVRLIEVVGEAASRISVQTRNKTQTIPWRQIIGMRNRLIHGYDILDLNILWDTVVTELPPLIAELENALQRIR